MILLRPRFQIQSILACLLVLSFVFCHSQVSRAQINSVKEVDNIHLRCADCYVSNQHHILSDGAVQSLNATLKQIEDSVGAQIAVVVLQNIGNANARDFSMDLYNYWKLGRKGVDDGMIILLVVDSRDVFLRTGYGLEGVFPDATCEQIFRRYMAPAFRKGDWDEGMRAAVQAVAQTLFQSGEGGKIGTDAAETRTFSRSTFFQTWMWISLLMVVAAFASLLFSLKNKWNKREAAYAKLTSQLKKWSIAGVLFPLLWLIFTPIALSIRRRIRRKIPRCNHCNIKMKQLNEQDDDLYLSESQRMEEVLHSKDYDVWLCPTCSHTEIFGYKKNQSPYEECPHCANKTMIQENVYTIRRAMPSKEGLERTTYRCKYCNGIKEIDKILPTLLAAGGGRFGGGIGGGMGGGSWGGGFSGGGGAGGRF